ncbi:ABC transporter ATP-binding protein [Streptomyces mirabilis]|uniref:ABC transporter ATP-binding protein n=1 Tax=Streptomyces mirabilis TaxID=68239 RepID=UPI000765A092|nr:ATP-binding cassette domain-containing protein [Streptomyces mirabilis]MCX4428632.1 ATP-binding cassette domain-containing protein [Streptomyces mirabilis]
MIEMKSVVAGYGGGDVLQGVELMVREGAITCIVGPNGAGKSTVLRAISGQVSPREGHITLAGERISGRTPAQVITAGIVQVPQQGGLFADLTIRDNMLLGGYLIRRDRARLKRRIAELGEAFPIIRERAGERAANLSGGQRRIVEFARALVLEPRVVLLDEPTLGLDPKASQLVFDSTLMMRDLGTTVLMVEQNVRFGLKLAAHGVVMERGRVLLEDSAEGLLKRPDMAALFFGSAPGPTAAGVSAEPDPARVGGANA